MSKQILQQINQTQQVELMFNLNQFKKDISEEIIYGKKLKFNYINADKFVELLDSRHIPRENLSYLDILKYNFEEIIEQLADYFPDIKINKFDNSPCVSECKIKQEEFTYKYDIYLVLSKDDKIYEYGFDFVSDLNNIYPNKYTDSKTLLDNYEYFVKDDVNTNLDIKYYLNDILFGLLTTICALKDDEYKLAEIIFAKSNQENKTQKEILKQVGYFLRIIEWKKSNLINLDDLFDNLMLENSKTNEQINKKQFFKIINEICTDKNINFTIKQDTITYEIFETLLLNINSKYNSQVLQQYKKTYLKAMELLLESLKIIINMVKEINMKKKFTPDYINNLVLFHLKEYKDQDTINNIYLNKINEKKILFENLFNEITKYCNKNKHNDHKLEKIKNDFDLLYDSVFNV
jgi:hypothetical protein